VNPDSFFWRTVLVGGSVQWELDRLELGERVAGINALDRLREQMTVRGVVLRQAS